jgi:Ca-activated chloride channel homolog
MLEFEWWWVFILLPLPWILRYILPAKHEAEPSALRLPFFQEWVIMERNTSQQARADQSFKWRLTLIWILLVSATANPHRVGDPLGKVTSGRDLMLAVDISGSMEATDLAIQGHLYPRLEVVKNVLNEFIDNRDGDRLGLILFGENAYLQTPLTFDRETVRTMLNEAQIGFAGSSRTAIGDGIGLAVKRLKERPEQNRVLILLTDGQNNTGEIDPIKAAELASKAGIKIYTVGVGADEMLIRSFRTGSTRMQGSTELDEATLKEVARLANGQYFRARNTEELKDIYTILDELEPVDGDEHLFRPRESLFIYPMILCLLIIFIPALYFILQTKFAVVKISSKENGKAL